MPDELDISPAKRYAGVLREIQRIAPGTQFTPTSMQLPKDLPYDKWCAVGKLLRSLGGPSDA